MRWVAIPDYVESQLRLIADERDTQKRGFASSRYWNAHSHYIGLMGEWVFSEVAGIQMNTDLALTGDGGQDFQGVDVKTSTFLSDPHLKHPASSGRWPDFFALVVVDLKESRGSYRGYATRDELRAAPTRDYGHGLQHHLPEAALHKTLPPSLSTASVSSVSTPLATRHGIEAVEKEVQHG